MLKELTWPEDRSYRSSSVNEPIEFYLDALTNSTRFDLLLGYFSSSAINVLSLGFAHFLYSGGKMRIIANNILSQRDRDSIKKGIDKQVNSGLLDITDIKQLKRSLDDYGHHFFDCLSWLIANERIELIVIRPKNSQGISHYKSGVFYDGVNSVGYKSSCNFTAFGLMENLEELDAFLSWENGRSNKMIKSQESYFNEIFSKRADFVEYVPTEEIEVAVQDYFGNKSLQELLVQEADLLRRKSSYLGKKSLLQKINEVSETLEYFVQKPRFPYPDGPRKYQNEAYNNWVANGKKGVFAMATGTGKTITSLNCILEEYKNIKSYRVLIIVPTRVLIDQWEAECKKFNYQNIIKISSLEDWSNDLSICLSSSKYNSEFSFIAIATYASFNKKKFQLRLKDFPRDSILIADEAHNLGSPQSIRSIQNIHIEKRIGLSATPERQYDDMGNQAINTFFDDEYPYVVSFTMNKAINDGVLCRYFYFPHLVPLTVDEQEEYAQITQQLMKYFDPAKGSFKDDDRVSMLLIRRKNIIHKAEYKKEAFEKIVKEELNTDTKLQYTLVYAPEGLEPDYSEQESLEDSDDDINVIDSYTRIVSRSHPKVTIQQYTSRLSSKERELALDNFFKGKTNVLISMKCLDEGVDVPRSETAIFCASTGNPRQFIQRRGRVLRKHPKKTFAFIHDLVVIPKLSSALEPTFNMERNLVKGELARVVNFSFLSENKYQSFEILKHVCDHYELNLFEIEKELKSKHSI